MLKYFLFLLIITSTSYNPYYKPTKLTIKEIKEISLPPISYSSNKNQTSKNVSKSKQNKKKEFAKNHNHKTHLVKFAKKFLGTRYRWGGTGKGGVDCSGFVKLVYSKTVRVKLPRTSYKQFKVGKKVNKNSAKVGDLIFFSDSKRPVGHVGIIIDPRRNLMIHASSGAKRVTITNYNKPYYRKHFKGVRRII